jgi:hypothetical protein
MALHRAYFEPGSLIVVLSPTDRQSGETVNKAKAFASQMGLPSRGDGLNRISLKLPNGSRIVGLPGRDGTVRGFSNVSLLMSPPPASAASSGSSGPKAALADLNHM